MATIRHIGPSTIGIDTILRSEGAISETFLRGTGATDTFINYVRSLAQTPFNFYFCFISYSSKDEILARRLHADLQNRGVRCWFAPKDMKIGNKLRDRIDEAIHLQEKLLLLLSEHSIASVWVESEVEAALEKEDRQQRKGEVLFPVKLDESVMRTSKAWAATLRRTRHIGDFTNWTDPQAYQQAFERLLRDLKRAGEAE
ncbi:MAG TPA: toll/interleukin-1 receptor domain-containing protein [Ktedonobacteraceae bacterium]|nr:toll/interleukin-1 receptor domain-containing protein [Ktedonobacteraceae bacterium]